MILNLNPWMNLSKFSDFGLESNITFLIESSSVYVFPQVLFLLPLLCPLPAEASLDPLPGRSCLLVLFHHVLGQGNDFLPLDKIALDISSLTGYFLLS